MPIRCPNCGYSNDPEFRFCGMCGAPVNRSNDEPIRQRPMAAQPPPERTAARPAKPTSNFAASSAAEDDVWPIDVDTPLPRRESAQKQAYVSVSGPSFLGLDPIASSSEPAPQYLLDDDEPTGHGRLWVGIAFLLAVGGGLFWQWQREGYPWNPAPKPIASSVSGGSGDTAAATPSSAGSSPEATPPASSPPENKAGTQPTEPAKEDKPPDRSAESVSLTQEDKPEPQPAKLVAPMKNARPGVRTPAAAPDPADLPDPSEALFLDGQKYLYGSGVPEDCNRARTKLMAAANQSNVKAQSTVATMYATGHCMPRNLPLAYRWFAMALHQDRDNSRLQRDLEMLWNQMTAEEKQIAIKTRQ